MSNSCLGIEFLGMCDYSPSSPSFTILGFGEALAVISILITFSQILSLPKKEIIQEKVYSAYKLGVVGIILVLIGAILPLIPGPALPLIGYPVVWELIGSILLLVIIVKLIYHYHAPLKFEPKSAEKTVRITTRVIAKGSEADLVELAGLLTPSLDKIVKSLSEFDSLEAHRAKEENRKYVVKETTRLALHLVKVLADPFFCRAVVKKHPEFLAQLVEELKARKIRLVQARILIWEIVNQSLLNEESIIHRERSYHGLGISKSITNALFNDFEFNENVMPLSNWHLYASDFENKKAFELFCECYLVTVDAVIKEDRLFRSLSLNHGKIFAEYPSVLIYRLDSLRSEDVYNSYGYKIFSIACRTLEEMIEKVTQTNAANEEEFLKWSMELTEYRIRESVLGLIAEFMYELLEAASHTRVHDTVLRTPLVGPWFAIFAFDSKLRESHKVIQKHLVDMIFEKLKVNFEEGMYPAVSRSVFSILGLFDGEGYTTKDKEFREKFFSYVKTHFKSLYEKDKELALDKLPNDTVFDEKESCLVETVHKRTVRKMHIP